MFDHLTKDLYSEEHSLGNIVLKCYLDSWKFPKIRKGFLYASTHKTGNSVDIKIFLRLTWENSMLTEKI